MFIIVYLKLMVQLVTIICYVFCCSRCVGLNTFTSTSLRRIRCMLLFPLACKLMTLLSILDVSARLAFLQESLNSLRLRRSFLILCDWPHLFLWLTYATSNMLLFLVSFSDRKWGSMFFQSWKLTFKGSGHSSNDRVATWSLKSPKVPF